MNRAKPKYPEGWDEFSRFIRFTRAGGVCECVGECGLHKTNPGSRRCCEWDGHKAKWARGIVRLTVAHTCKCDPPCINPEHVKAMCQRCHLRLDVDLHVRHSKETREKKKWHNQLALPIA